MHDNFDFTLGADRVELLEKLLGSISFAPLARIVQPFLLLENSSGHNSDFLQQGSRTI